MIQYKIKLYKSADLQLGFQGNSCCFDWRPFDRRSAEAQAAYLKLKDSLHAVGVRDPLITYRGHVLVGQRRFEIMRDRVPVFVCYEVLEKVEDWRGPDIERLDAFKREKYPAMDQYIG